MGPRIETDDPLPTFARRRELLKQSNAAASAARYRRRAAELARRERDGLAAGLALAAAYTPPPLDLSCDVVSAARYGAECRKRHWAEYAMFRRECRRARSAWEHGGRLSWEISFELHPSEDRDFNDAFLRSIDAKHATPTPERFAENHTAPRALLVNLPALQTATYVLGAAPRWVRQVSISWASRTLGPPPIEWWARERVARLTERAVAYKFSKAVAGNWKKNRLVDGTWKYKLIGGKWRKKRVYKWIVTPRLALAVLVRPRVMCDPADWLYHHEGTLFYLDCEDLVSHADKAANQLAPPWLTRAVPLVALTGLHSPTPAAIVRALVKAWRGPKGSVWLWREATLPWVDEPRRGQRLPLATPAPSVPTARTD